MYLNSICSELKKRLIECPPDVPTIRTMEIGWSDRIRIGAGIAGQKMKIGNRLFADGWGDHASSRHIIHIPGRAVKFEVMAGVISDPEGRITFSVEDMDGNVLADTAELTVRDDAVLLSADLPLCTDFVIRSFASEAAAKGWTAANLLWGDPCITLEDGTQLKGRDFVCYEQSPINSFNYDGEPFIPAASTVTLMEETDDLQKFIREDTSADGALTVRTTITVYKDFPVIEYLPELLNRSDKNSGLVSDFKSLDLPLDLHDRSCGYLPTKDGFSCTYAIHDVALRRTLGSKNCQSDFTEETVWLRPRYPEDHIRLETDEGRSSAAWLPYFGLDETDEQGLNIAVGWSGAWYADFRMRSLQLSVQAGMPETHFRVLPGETLRQVSMILHHRNGLNVVDGQNQFRRFALKYHTPRRADGTVHRVPFSFSSWGGNKTENHLKNLALLAREKPGYEVYWVDAGWFGGDRPVASSEFGESDWYTTVGNWIINRWAHPDGFKPIADAAHEAGLKFLLWYEMERVMKGTPVAKEHPEWMLDTGKKSGHYLLNFGVPEAVDWAVEQVAYMVREHGLDHYRQDFNFNTLPFWYDNDAPDRIGVNEMKHIAGLYTFWDRLREMFPDMLIDNCASGGRRLDFETNSRSICLFRSDMLGRHWYDSSEASQVMSTYLSRWIPATGGGCTFIDQDDYSLFAGSIPGSSSPIQDGYEDVDFEWMRKTYAALHRMRELCYGNWYLLAEAPESHKDIFAYQCDSPEKGEGYFIAFRRPAGNESSRILQLQKIDPSAMYRLEVHRGGTKQMSGAELQKYLLEMPQPRTMHLVFYKKI